MYTKFIVIERYYAKLLTMNFYFTTSLYFGIITSNENMLNEKVVLRQCIAKHIFLNLISITVFRKEPNAITVTPKTQCGSNCFMLPSQISVKVAHTCFAFS